MPTPPPNHPWSGHLNIRTSFRRSTVLDPNDVHPSPYRYNDKDDIQAPSDKPTTLREYISLEDVVAFRNAAVHVPKTKKKTKKGSVGAVDNITEALSTLSIDIKRPVLYRYTDVVKKSYGILEAVHFEIFMPDRPDLRFIAIPLTELPKDICEGEYLFTFAVTRLEVQLPVMNAAQQYPITWRITRFQRQTERSIPMEDFVYITGKARDADASVGVSNWTDDMFQLRARRFDPNCERKVDTICEATLYDTSSAWIYPVEPPKNRVQYAQMVGKIRSTSRYEGTFATEVRPLEKRDADKITDRLAEFKEFMLNPEDSEKFLVRLFELGVRYRVNVTAPDIQSVQISSIDPPTVVMHALKSRVEAITILFDTQNVRLTVNNISRAKGKRYYTKLTCGGSAALTRAMGRVPNNAWVDAMIHNDQSSIVLKHLLRIGEDLEDFEEDDDGYENNQRPTMTTQQPEMLSYLYCRNKKRYKYTSSGLFSIKKVDGRLLKLNEQQSRAVVIYQNLQEPGFCILSPPGSGKTTVAAVMAASFDGVLERKKHKKVQLLLAVQNVAVDNLAESLSSFDDDYLKAYHLKSMARLDADAHTPYDLFEELPNYKRWMRGAEAKDLRAVEKFLYDVAPEYEQAKTNPARRLSKKDMMELEHLYHETLKRAKSALERYMDPDIILSTVDMILYRLLGLATIGLRGQLWNVDRIIIDEASLLTESAYYCLIRSFPTAKFVLIGDDQQLPPFMFDEGVLGHELAGRSALEVSLTKKNLPVINLVEVYRAPQKLVAPYNKLSYEGRLISKKVDKNEPLTKIGLVGAGKAQLVFVDVKGESKRGLNSMHNPCEKNALLRLLRKFPANQKDDIMIISLYKEQKRQIERVLGTEYDVYTVDSSQGKEKPIVIVLTSRSTQTSNMGFFNCQKRCTVAVSRQQRALIIFGCKSIIENNHPWSTVIKSGDFTRIDSSCI